MKVKVKAEPSNYEYELKKMALILIDFQNDFLLPKGFGESLGNDVHLLWKAVSPTKKVLEEFRKKKLPIFHTREGHSPDLSDVPEIKLKIGNSKIGEKGPMGRILIKGQEGHQIIKELTPLKDEEVIDKPGKGAFYNTLFDQKLKLKGIKYLIITGVTTEVCVQSTVREANDRGYSVLVLKDCVSSYKPKLHKAALDMIVSQSGIFGYIANSKDFLNSFR